MNQRGRSQLRATGVRKGPAHRRRNTMEGIPMRQVLLATVLYTAALSGQAHAQGFTPQELDRMSQEKLNSGAYRDRLGGTPPPQSSVRRDALHEPQGLWVCMSTDEGLPILASPQAGAPKIGVSSGQIAAGADRGAFTSVLYREGTIGYVPKAAVRPYQNQFNPHATCTVAGVRANGVLVFSVR